jgi:hypothetical protein
MKKTLLFITLCLVTGFAVAKPVSQTAATHVANQFWQSVLHGQGQLHPMPWQYSEIYLFVGDQGGFVMVSADDCARPVIAYSLHGSLSQGTLPVQLSQRMEAYCGLIAEGVNKRVAASAADAAQWEQLMSGIEPKDGDNDDRVGPLLETHWHQDGGYALLTPQHTPTGCAATAQAQVMRYWRYPAFGHGYETYNCPPYGAQSADFSHTLYDWGNMPDQVTLGSPYEQQIAVSTLMYHVGVSLHMGYAPGGSAAAGVVGRPGVPSIDNSLKDHFYYSRSMRPIFRTDGYSDQQWADSLVTELRLHHPIIYCGVAPEGGHGFVCDGYEYRGGQVFFHFNFGWSGNGDGYYTVDDICPNVSPTGEVGSVYHFNQSNQALLGAVPDGELHVSDSMLTFTREGGNRQLLFCGIDTASAWGDGESPLVISADQPWVTVERNEAEPVGATGNPRWYIVAAEENTTGSERQATITFTREGRGTTAGMSSVSVTVVQTYYSPEEYCPLTVVMESTRGGGWEGGAHLSFESLSGYVYGTAALASGSSATVEVGVAPHDVNVVFHHGGGTDRYINYRVLNRHGEELVGVDYAFMNGGTHFIEWPCARLGIGEQPAEASACRVWPNPARDVLHIEAAALLCAELYDMYGRRVATTSGSDMNLAGLPTGVYFLRAVTDMGVSFLKLKIEN